MATAAERLAGSLADRYRIERELGGGRAGAVFLAEDLRDHRQVAIKLIHSELSALLDHDRFLKEIKLSSRLEHPHILPILDFGTAGGLLYYVMPYVEGETLRARLTRDGQLSVPDAVRIAIDAADALHHACKHHVPHRAIKPENIILLGGRPLVMDFGVFSAVDRAGGQKVIRDTLLDMPQYMSPEQATSGRHVDHRADIYSLGVVTYEMLAGEPPFKGPTPQSIVARVVTEKPRSLTSIRDTVPRYLDDAVFDALQKLPADRPETARDFAHSLAEPQPSSSFEFVPAQRTSSTSLAAGVLLTAVLFGIAGYALGYRTHNSSSGDEETILYTGDVPGEKPRADERLRASLTRAGFSDVVEARYGAGHVVYMLSDATLWAAPFDKKRNSPTAEPVQIATGVSTAGTGVAQFGLSRSGNLLYIPDEPAALVLVDRDGKLRYVTSDRRLFHSPRFSPDGNLISVDFITPSGREVWILSLDGRKMWRATAKRDAHDATWSRDGQFIVYSTSSERTYPALSPNGKWIAYVTNRAEAHEVYVRQADGSGNEIQISLSGGREPVWSPDNRKLYYRGVSNGEIGLIEATLSDSSALGVTSRRTLFPVSDMVPAAAHANYDISPDGRTFVLVRRSAPQRIIELRNLPEIVKAKRDSSS